MHSPHKIDHSRLRVLESVFDDQMALIRCTEKNIEDLIDERVEVERVIRILESGSRGGEAEARIGRGNSNGLNYNNPNMSSDRAPASLSHPDAATRTPTLMQRIAGINSKIAALREERAAIEDRLDASQGLFDRCRNFIATGDIA